MYRLLWEDNFDYEGTPNPTLWNVEVAGHGFGNNEAQYYTNRTQNVNVQNGELIITGLKEDYVNRHYTSAKLTTEGKKHLRYGRIEVMASLPKGAGTWPAIWFLGTDIDQLGWPACGEIDLMEHVGHNPETIHFSLHSKTNYHHIGNQPTAVFKIPGILEGFHEYRMDWTEEEIAFYLDQKLMVTFKKKDYIHRAAWPFDKEYYLILNLALGGTWGGPIDDTIFPTVMRFKYVKVYERID